MRQPQQAAQAKDLTSERPQMQDCRRRMVRMVPMLLGFPHRFERDHPSPEMVPLAIKFLPGAPDEMDAFVNLISNALYPVSVAISRLCSSRYCCFQFFQGRQRVSCGFAFLNVTLQLQQLAQASYDNGFGFFNPVWNVISGNVYQTSFQKRCPKSLFVGFLTRRAHVSTLRFYCGLSSGQK